MGGRHDSRAPTNSKQWLAVVYVAAFAAIAFAAPARADDGLQLGAGSPLRSIVRPPSLWLKMTWRRYPTMWWCPRRCSGLDDRLSADGALRRPRHSRWKALQMRDQPPVSRRTTLCRHGMQRRSRRRYHSRLQWSQGRLPKSGAPPEERALSTALVGSITGSQRSISGRPDAARKSTARRAWRTVPPTSTSSADVTGDSN